MKTKLEIGDKLGKWTVLSFDRVDEKRRRRYNCRCECGVEQSVMAAAIAAGRTKSCPRCKSEDLTGKTFGLWTVLRRSDNDSKGTGYKTQWMCKCKCGKESLVERCNLVKGTSKGCWSCRRNVIDAQFFPKIWYRRLLEQAKTRGYEFSISEQELWNIWESQNGKCPLTGLDIKIVNDNSTTASVDRILNQFGYVLDNVWFVHKHINMMKHKYDLQYFVEMCHLVSQRQDNIRKKTS